MDVSFSAELFAWSGDKATWVFVALPLETSDAIDDATSLTGGFGSVKVVATLGSTTWSTSLFPDKKRATYILPVKKAVRSAEVVDVGDKATFHLEVVHV